jgi:hypothetical protein
VGAAQLEPEPPVGRIQPGGAFDNLNALLKVATLAAFIGGLNHAIQGTLGNQLRSFHYGKLDAEVFCASQTPQ